jgi:hypothetical protein
MSGFERGNSRVAAFTLRIRRYDRLGDEYETSQKAITPPNPLRRSRTHPLSDLVRLGVEKSMPPSC